MVAKSDAVHATLKAALQRARSPRVRSPWSRAGRRRGRGPSTRRSAATAACARASTDTDAPRDARTHFEISEALCRTHAARVTLETGRTHQIRVHLQAIGHPVAGDPEYGHAGLLGPQRQFLHAERLAFTHPVTGEPVELRSPLPQTSTALRRARA